jgi:hypothetical protein
MKEMTQEELQDRAAAIQRSRKIFIESGMTDNVTNAFIAYQAIFAEREREIFISTQVGGNRAPTRMDKYERPKCPDCDADMMFRNVPDNEEGVKLQLVCTKCDLVLNSENDIIWWMNNLKVKV